MIVALSDRSSWSRLGEFLTRELTLLSPATSHRLQAEWERIAADERSLDDLLVVGLVGGTGVGKSTLINALAGEVISTSSDRRPTTDRVIVYRHESTPLPHGMPIADIVEPQRLHNNAALSRVVVLDFPDFDSVDRLHHEVLGRFQPRLDVLFLLVDDVKYADERLYEFLKQLPQSRENFYIVLNKIDSLQDRYPQEWQNVVDGILSDLRAKLVHYAHLDVPDERFLAISARVALEARREGTALSALSAGAGEFGACVKLLEAYRQEQRRRAAKELNIEARQLDLANELAPLAGEGLSAMKVARALESLRDRRAEHERTVATLGATVLSADERHLMAVERLRQNAQSFGFPVDFLLTFKGFLRWKSAKGRRHLAGLTSQRLRRHFRPYLESVDNTVRSARLEVAGVVELPARETDEPENLFVRTIAEHQGRVREWENRLKRRWSIWNHAAALVVALGFVLTLVHPALRIGIETWRESGSVPWGDVGSQLAVSFVSGGLNPLFLAGFVLSLVLAYVLAAVVAWTRQLQRLERTFRRTEAESGVEASECGEARMRTAESALERWQTEREELAGLVRALQHELEDGASVAASDEP